MTYQSVRLTAEMLLPFLISQAVVATLAISFHKYPYVFLLDVGNEEIPKANTEQIRLSIPGGSLALKYPATGDGDIIGHVRVSGIDFGTDLKASIVQGGPGYKYVVLVFIGKPGTTYDAVVTIETLDSGAASSIMTIDNTKEVTDNDINDSAEDMDDGVEMKKMYIENSDTVITQSSSNVYKYVSSDSDANGNDNVDDISKSSEELASHDPSEETDEEIEKQDSNDFSEEDKSLNKYLTGEITEETNDDDSSLENSNKYQYGKYEAFRPLFIGGIRFYPQSAIYLQDYIKSEEQNHLSEQNGAQAVGDLLSNLKYTDGNNNNIDPDYGSPVEY